MFGRISERVGLVDRQRPLEGRDERSGADVIGNERADTEGKALAKACRLDGQVGGAEAHAVERAELADTRCAQPVLPARQRRLKPSVRHVYKRRVGDGRSIAEHIIAL